MLNELRGDTIICILFLGLARFAIPLFFFLLSVFFDTGFWNAPMFSSPNGNISRLPQNLKVTALASRAPGTVEGYQRAINRWKSFATQALQVPCFPVSPTNFALYIQYLLEQTSSASTINTAFYAINWAHKLAGLESPTDHPATSLIKEGAEHVPKNVTERSP